MSVKRLEASESVSIVFGVGGWTLEGSDQSSEADESGRDRTAQRRMRREVGE